MRRILAAMLVLVLMLVSGCQKADEVTDASTETDPIQTETTPAPPDAPEPTPEPTPVPVVALKDYAYETVDNQTLGVRFKYPSHWINIPGTNTIAYEEPVEPGDTPARMSITRKQAGNIVVTLEVGMYQLDKFSKSLKKQYTNYKKNKGKRFKFAGNTGFSFTYTAELDGVSIKGYAALAYTKGKKNSFYLLHFYASAEDYANFDSIRKTIVKSVKI